MALNKSINENTSESKIDYLSNSLNPKTPTTVLPCLKPKFKIYFMKT